LPTLVTLDEERKKLSRLQTWWEKAILKSNFCTEDSAVCAEHCDITIWDWWVTMEYTENCLF